VLCEEVERTLRIALLTEPASPLTSKRR
jgi:hypothetical protein